MEGAPVRQSGENGEIKVTFHGNVAVIKMCRGENRVNFDFVNKMMAAIDEVERNPSVQILVTTGEGKFYGNGLDLDWILDSYGRIPDFDIGTPLNTLMMRLLTAPFVTVAAINGHAFAAGAFIALAHDYQVMNSDKGWWCLNEVHIGLFFSNTLLELLKTRLPAGHTYSEAAVLGRRYTAQEAKQAGVVQEICKGNDVIATASRLGQKILPKDGYNRQFLSNMKNNAYKHIIEAPNDGNVGGAIKSKMSKL